MTSWIAVTANEPRPTATRFRGFEMWRRAIGAFGELLLEPADNMLYATSKESPDRIVGNYSIDAEFGYAWPAIKWSRRHRKFKNISHDQQETIL